MCQMPMHIFALKPLALRQALSTMECWGLL